MKNMTPIHPFPLGSVRVEDPYLLHAIERETEYLLSLQEGRLLAGFYENAGIQTSYVRYGGWESGLIGGHTLGHYLTAVSQAAIHPNVRERELFLERTKQIVDALALCQQNSKGKPGFVWGAPQTGRGAEAQFDCVEAGKTDVKTQAWVPWYTMHKILSGLIAAYCNTGYAPALETASRLGDWVFARVSMHSKETRARVLAVEYGGMNDALYELFLLTGKEEHALAAHYFDEEELFERILSEGEDVLNGLHANTTIPKVLGAMNRYLVLHGQTLCGERVDASRYLKVAESFFRMVAERHTYVTGGHSEWEHFGKDYVLDAERTACNCETCNVYNMLKLARLLFCATGDKRYTDFYDNAFVNHILSSQNPETGMTTYFQAMASGYFKVFSTPENSFWCCTGTGMENFTKLGDSAYYAGEKNLYVEQYLSSSLNAEHFAVTQICDFPKDDWAKFKVERADEPFLMCFRVPDWAAGELEAKRNGGKVNLIDAKGHVCLAVRAGDEIELKIPVEFTLKGLPDGKNAFAIKHGGAVLSADLGREEMSETFTGIDVAIPREKRGSDEVVMKDLYDFFESPSKYVRREGDGYILTGADREIPLKLHYRRWRERYAIYLRFLEKSAE